MRAFARFPVVRRAVRTGYRVRASRVAPAVGPAVVRLHRTLDDLIGALRTTGLAVGLELPPEVVTDVLEFADRTPCFADRDESLGFHLADRSRVESTLGKPVLVAQYFNTESLCPSVAAIAGDPLLLEIAARFLQTRPTFLGANMWWTFDVNPTEADRDRHAHLFHRDLDDFAFLKVFFYMTEVVPGDGAHICVEGSQHRPPRGTRGGFSRLRRYSDAEITSQYSTEHITEICGPAGTGFVEDTMCVHKGLTPSANPRLVLQFVYGLHDYGVMHDRRSPAELRMITEGGRRGSRSR
jgi:hypothetical protein